MQVIGSKRRFVAPSLGLSVVEFLRAVVIVLLSLVLLGASPSVGQAGPKFAALTVDARNGKVLFQENADGIRHPASLTKMMTLYVLFQDLKAGKINLDSPIRMSARAAGMAPSKLGVKPGKTITVETAIRALVVKSANDVAAAVAENLGGTEAAFAKRMTRTARALGMSRTTFVNASGLPDSDQVTTARDMATLGLRLMRDYPQYYPYFRATSFTYAGRTIKGHNRLLGKFEGTDGIKTGYIHASGFNLVSSARRGQKRLVGVVLGGKTGNSRNAYMMKMLEKQFPRAANGKTIAAMPGSSKGVIDPLEVAGEAPGKKPERSVVASGNTDDAGLKAKIAEVQAAEPEEGDTGDEAQDEGTDGTTKVIKAELGGQQLPAELPFEVKSPAQKSDVDAQVVASVAAEGDWTIQVGAFYKKTDARAYLLQVQEKFGKVLAGKTALTVAVKKGKKTTYRSRFTGFSKNSAKAACKQIAKTKSGCYVLAPAS